MYLGYRERRKVRTRHIKLAYINENRQEWEGRFYNDRSGEYYCLPKGMFAFKIGEECPDVIGCKYCYVFNVEFRAVKKNEAIPLLSDYLESKGVK